MNRERRNHDDNENMQGAAVTANRSEKKWMTALLLCLLGGGIGAHQYYVGKVGMGILYTLTVGLFGIGYIIDLIKIATGKFTDKDGKVLMKDG